MYKIIYKLSLIIAFLGLGSIANAANTIQFKGNIRLLAKIKKRSAFCLFFIHIKKSCSTIMST